MAAAAALVVVVGAVVIGTTVTTGGAAAPPPIPAPDVSYGGPITITSGGTYAGAWESSSPGVPAVTVATSEPVVIERCAVRGPGTLIQVQVGQRDADVTVRHCYGEGTSSRSESRFVVFDSGWKRAVVESNDLVRTAGMWFHRATPEEVRVVANRAREITTDAGFVQFTQFDKVTGPLEVAWNEVVNTPGSSRVEDVINLFSSGGTPAAPARIHDNFLWGAYPNPPAGSSFSGGGIMVGDHGSDAGHVVVESNQVVGTTNYGISVVCGTDQVVNDNTIVSSGRTADGTGLPATNVGLSMGSEARWGVGCSTYSGNDATGNDIGWQKPSGSRNDRWTPDCAICTANVTRTGEVTYAAEQAEWDRWLAKTRGLRIGRTIRSTDATLPAAGTPSTTAPPTSTTTVSPSTTTTTAAATPVDPDALQARIDELEAELAAERRRMAELLSALDQTTDPYR